MVQRKKLHAQDNIVLRNREVPLLNRQGDQTPGLIIESSAGIHMKPTVVAILTDIHFWIPATVLALGVGLLLYVR